jgi:hypothetical protein
MLQEIPISGNEENALHSFLLEVAAWTKSASASCLQSADTNKHYELFANACDIDNLMSYMQAKKAYAKIMPQLFLDTTSVM